MSAEKRESGKLNIDCRLAAFLVSLRLHEGADLPTTLDLETVRDVDRALGFCLPDEILALFAAKIPSFEKEKMMSLSRVVGHTGKAHVLGGLGDLVGIGKLDKNTFICIEKSFNQDSAFLILFDTNGGKRTKLTLMDWLETVAKEKGLDCSEQERLASKFEPVIVRPLPAGSPGMQVFHSKFGMGRVLKEIGGGPNRKIQVDFPGHGLKLIHAGFLEWIE